MTVTILKTTLAGLVLAVLSACGGADPAPAPMASPAVASTVTARPAPSCDSHDCAPVIDGLAEEFRSRAQRGKPVPDAEASAAPAYPQVAADAVMAPPPPAPAAFGSEGS